MKLWNKYKTLLNKSEINTSLRLSHFFAQIDHESNGFKNLKELGDDKYFLKYEGRKDLGNIKLGDGLKYKGRGYIQVTGRTNYSNISKDFGVDFLKYPELLEQEINALLSAIWFWNKKKLNVYADKDDILTITKKINGGTNGLIHRKQLLTKYKTIFKL